MIIEPYDNGSLKFDERCKFYERWINYSDIITTVSNSYADEIKQLNMVKD